MKNRLNLAYQLARRDVIGRYRGSIFGVLWSFFNPLLLLMVYGFVFSTVFSVRWTEQPEQPGEFGIILFIGLALHSFLAEVMSKSLSIISSNSNFVKKIVFPLEVLAPVTLLSAGTHFLISLAIIIMGEIIFFDHYSWKLCLIPLVLGPFVILLLGIAWLFSSLGVYLKDLLQVVNLLITVLLFFSTILYPISRLPKFVQSIIYLNPLSLIVEQLRDIIIWNKMPNFQYLLLYSLCSALIALLGYCWFQKTRKGFADVL